MANTEPAGCAGKTAIGNERDFIAHALTVNSGCGGQHFAHARAAFRAFVTDHDNVAFFVIALFNGIKSIFFAVKATRDASENQIFHASDFNQRAFRGEIALQANNTASR